MCNNLGSALKDQGHVAQAIENYRHALRINPDHAVARNNLGIALQDQGELAESIECFRQALHGNPGFADAHFYLGTALFEQGQIDEAVDCFRQALQIDPNHAEAHNNLGNALSRLDHFAAAADCYRQALLLKPHLADTHNNLGIALEKQGKLAAAAECYRQALGLNPNFADAYSSLGRILKGQGQLVEAIAYCRQALRINPDHAGAHINMGAALHEQGDLAGAEECFRQALRIDPNHASAHLNMGAALNEQGDLAKAEECFQQALRIDPSDARARLNRACLRLLQGDLEGGWPDYEKRLALGWAVPRSFEQPRWDGSTLEGKTILIHAEQGLGDTLLFIRYARLVKERGGKVVFECQRSLVPLLEGMPGVDQIVPQDQAGKPDCRTVQLPPFDVHIPLMSLPGIFATTVTTIPGEVPYLRADPERVKRWRRELAVQDGFKIGIAWQGNPQHERDRRRSVALSYFEPLARLEGIRLVSVQKGPGTEQLALGIGNPPDLRQEAGRSPVGPIIDFGDRLDATGAFLDTAAVMLNLNLVVTVDTAVAHLAGALGVPAWVVLPFVPDWRWLLERSDSPWYPTLRLFRQRRAGDWGEVFERIAAEVRNVIERR